MMPPPPMPQIAYPPPAWQSAQRQKQAEAIAFLAAKQSARQALAGGAPMSPLPPNLAGAPLPPPMPGLGSPLPPSMMGGLQTPAPASGPGMLLPPASLAGPATMPAPAPAGMGAPAPAMPMPATPTPMAAGGQVPPVAPAVPSPTPAADPAEGLALLGHKLPSPDQAIPGLITPEQLSQYVMALKQA